MIPRTLGLAMTNINAVVVTMLASFLPVGSVAVYNYANNLQWFPIGLIGIPLLWPLFLFYPRRPLKTTSQILLKL